MKCQSCKTEFKIEPEDFNFYEKIKVPAPTFCPDCRQCWWSDKWDPIDYGQDYDFSKPFFSQYKELQNRVPRISLYLFGYNETASQEHFPLSAKAAAKLGFNWREPEKKHYFFTVNVNDLADSIKEVKDSILNEIINCLECKKPFRIIKPELEFLKKQNLPLPRKCPDCRHLARVKKRAPFKLWQRQCQNQSCSNQFKTPYAPDRPEIIWCEACYNKEAI